MTTDSGVAAANNFDPRNEPAYTVAEASRYLKVASTTLRSWVFGRPYPKAEGVGRAMQADTVLRIAKKKLRKAHAHIDRQDERHRDLFLAYFKLKASFGDEAQ